MGSEALAKRPHCGHMRITQRFSNGMSYITWYSVQRTKHYHKWSCDTQRA